MERSFAADHSRPHIAVVNENEVRAAAGLTMVIGAVAFSYAYFAKQYVPLQVAASLFFAEFLIRITIGLRRSPIGVVARAMTVGRAPEWVSAKPKRFAWTLGLVMALAMTIITNSGIRGPLPRTMCLICLTLMWMESALGLCLGCKIYGLLLQRGWIGADPGIEVCADGSCSPSSQPTNNAARRVSSSASGVLSVALAVGALLAFAVPASAARAPSGDPVRFWSVSKVEQGAGEVPVASGAQLGGVLQKVVDLGNIAFNFRGTPLFDRASGDVFSSANGAHYSVGVAAPLLNLHRANSPKGGVTHLDEYQAYVKRSGDASLRIAITGAVLEAIDANARVNESQCPPTVVRCWPIRSIVRFHARAYAASAGGDFFNVGGVAFIKGRHALWDHWVATSSDSQAPVWTSENFIFDPDVDDSNTLSDARMVIDRPPVIKVPVASVRTGELFAVHVSLEAEAVNDRGAESAAQAYIRDPQGRGPALLTAHGLKPLGKPKFKEPAISSPKPARCPGGTSRNAGTIQLSAPSFSTSESSRDPLVLVTRTAGARGSASVTLTTRAGTASAGRDFRPTRTTVRFGSGDRTPRLVEIPIRQDKTTEPPEKFTVSVSHPRCATLGARRSASVTILDDDQPPSPPPPAFTIGGTVDGLQGSGLVLSNLGAELPVSGNGSFTFPGTASDAQGYEVNVTTQPHTPDQVCTVDHGTGHVASANVSNIAVHCSTLTTPSGLDSTFGSGGRVSTPVGGIGDGEAVVIQPNGGIVTAGSREVGTASDFVLTRHSPNGVLDTSFGTNGIAVTDLGGADDKAYDATLLPDGGIVAVGVADPAGFLKGDFGIVRYNPDGTPNTNFGSDGIVRTDIRGDADQAEAVAVQPDGKIVVAGLAAKVAGSLSDFALARYNADGSLDTSFGTGGIVTTDFGGEDAAVALAVQADGKIVAAGAASDHIALARYLPDGTLDPTFGSGGTTVNPGFGVANGLALTPGGGILLAGYRGADFLLLAYRPDGTPNPNFGHLGSVTTDINGGSTDFAENLVVDAQGRIILVGRATSPTILDMTLARYNADGTLDTSFANHGTLTADFHGRGEFGQDVALDSAGRIIAAGYTANGSDTDFALMRANS